MKFSELQKHDMFIIEADCGKAEFLKINTIQAICIASCNGTYQKCMAYTMQFDQVVTKTNK